MKRKDEKEREEKLQKLDELQRKIDGLREEIGGDTKPKSSKKITLGFSSEEHDESMLQREVIIDNDNHREEHKIICVDDDAKKIFEETKEVRAKITCELRGKAINRQLQGNPRDLLKMLDATIEGFLSDEDLVMPVLAVLIANAAMIQEKMKERGVGGGSIGQMLKGMFE